MRPGTYPLDLYRGDSYVWQFRLWTDLEGLIPADLTGVVAEAEIRERSGGTTIIVLPCTVLDNVVEMELPATAWATWTLPSGVWDLQLTYPDASVITILAGPVAVTGDVTDSTALLREVFPAPPRRAVVVR